MAAPKYLLGKLLTGTAGTAELAQLKPEYKNLIPNEPVTIATVLISYGPDKLAEVQEALSIAKEKKLGDISILLGAWIMNDAQKKASGIKGVSQATLGSRSTPDTEGVIGQFITGIKGSVPRQTEELKKQFDDAQAAVEATWRAAAKEVEGDEAEFVKFARDELKAKLTKGGRRKTRKSKKTLRRKAKKSRRSYK
jgi:hypothetical protein